MNFETFVKIESGEGGGGGLQAIHWPSSVSQYFENILPLEDRL